ncbi:MAG: DNA methylase [Lachnospiraceae bacterium]|nr:DNA methylase [Lachnospiraceae bacterium]
MPTDRCYVAIDLKSFYASIECVERNLDPMTTNLVVADASRTEKTICLAVSPSLKKHGLGGRCRLFEVVQKAREYKARTGKELTYITAPPRMQLYIDYSTRIYEIYLNYVSADDIHVYSIDEVFIDVTDYLSLYHKPPRELTKAMILDVLNTTGITAAAGIGTNLYLAKIAMDIVAKHVDADSDGVRIAELDEMKYRQLLWNHRPLTDFWRVGRGIARRLEKNGMFTMGDVARMSLTCEDVLYNEFGIDAELLIDHAWGAEPCTMADIKAYRPETNSISSGQVLSCAYDFEKGRLIIQEMVDLLVLDLVEKGLVTDSVTLQIGYDREMVDDKSYRGEIHVDRYGRKVPKPAHGTVRLTDAAGNPVFSSSTGKIMDASLSLYDQIVSPRLSVRRMNVTFNHVIPADSQPKETWQQLNLFTDYEALEREKQKEEKERKMQMAMLSIKQKYGKNAILKGMNLQEGATAMDRNRQIGGHKA